VYSSPSIIRMIKSRRMRWAGHVAQIGEKRNAYRILVGKTESTSPLGRQRRRCVENIKIDSRERGREKRQRGWVLWTGLIGLTIGTSGRLS
jgi:hypothetical protein